MQVRWIRVLYNNFTAFTEDQEYLISLHDKGRSQKFDYVEGFVIVDEGLINNWRSSFFSPKNPVKISSLGPRARSSNNGDVLYCLEITKNYLEYSDSVDQVFYFYSTFYQLVVYILLQDSIKYTLLLICLLLASCSIIQPAQHVTTNTSITVHAKSHKGPYQLVYEMCCLTNYKHFPSKKLNIICCLVSKSYSYFTKTSIIPNLVYSTNLLNNLSTDV